MDYQLLHHVAVALFGLIAVLYAITWTQIVLFVRHTPILRKKDWARLLQIVRFNMWGALALIVFLPLAFFLLILSGINTGGFFAESLLYGVPVVAMGAQLKRQETVLQTLPVDGKELRQERDRIVAIWRTKPFPLF